MNFMFFFLSSADDISHFRLTIILLLLINALRYHGTVLTTNYPSTGVVFWLDEVNCTGTEMDIASCQHNGWGVHDCDHNIEDVFIKCDPMTTGIICLLLLSKRV